MSGDMSMEQNQLTRDLYAAGYTREDHPPPSCTGAIGRISAISLRLY